MQGQAEPSLSRKFLGRQVSLAGRPAAQLMCADLCRERMQAAEHGRALKRQQRR